MKTRLISINGNGQASIGATGATRAANVATITTVAAHGFVVGAKVTIAGVTPASFNGTYVVATVADTTHFTYANTGPNETSTVGGTATPEYYDVLSTIAARRVTVVEDDSVTRQGLNYKSQDDSFAAVFNVSTTEQPIVLDSPEVKGGAGAGRALGMPEQNAPSTQTNYRAADVLIKLISRTSTSTKVRVTEQE